MQTNFSQTTQPAPLRLKIKPILEQVQILSQNGDIDAPTRQRLVSLLSNALRNNDSNSLAEFRREIQRLRYGAFNPSALEQLIMLTEQ